MPRSTNSRNLTSLTEPGTRGFDRGFGSVEDAVAEAVEARDGDGDGRPAGKAGRKPPSAIVIDFALERRIDLAWARLLVAGGEVYDSMEIVGARGRVDDAVVARIAGGFLYLCRSEEMYLQHAYPRKSTFIHRDGGFENLMPPMVQDLGGRAGRAKDVAERYLYAYHLRLICNFCLQLLTILLNAVNSNLLHYLIDPHDCAKITAKMAFCFIMGTHGKHQEILQQISTTGLLLTETT